MRYQKFQKLTAVQPFYRDSLSLTQFLGLGKTCVLTEVAGEGGPDLAPQNFFILLNICNYCIFIAIEIQ